MKKKAAFAQLVLETSLQMAEHQPWETIHLHGIADQLDCSLDEIREHYSGKEALVDAWFSRADQHMLRRSATAECSALPPHERLHFVIMAWLEALSPHRTVTRQMVLGGLAPGHLLRQLQGMRHIRRTVKWLREAAHRDASYLNRTLEETVLTAIFLSTLARWLQDSSSHYEETRTHLQRALDRSAFILHVTAENRFSPPSPLHSDEDRPESSTHH